MKDNDQNNIVQGTFGAMKRTDDFLPRPEELVLKDSDSVKVTMELDKNSVDFFKHEAKKFGSSYQRMIRNLIKEYVSHHTPSA